MKKRVTVIGVGSRFVALAEAAQGRGGPSLARLAPLPLREPLRRASEPEERRVQLAEALREGFKRLKIKPPPEAVLSLRQAEIKTRFATLPATSPDEIEQMARFEIEKAIPFERERHVSSSVALRVREPEGADTLMQAVDSPPLDAAVRALDQAGVSVERAEGAGWGLFRLYRQSVANAAKNKKEGAGASPLGMDRTLVACLGMGGADVLLVQDGMPVYTFHCAAGSLEKLLRKLREDGEASLVKRDAGMEVNMADFAALLADAAVEEDAKIPGAEDAEAPSDKSAGPAFDPAASVTGVWAALSSDDALGVWGKRLTQEITRGVHYAAGQAGFGKLQGALVTGPGAVIGGLCEYLSANLGVPVERLDPLAGLAPPKRPSGLPAIETAGADKKLGGWSEAELGLFAESVGAALDALEPEFGELDLAPGWYREKVARGKNRRSRLLTAAIALGAVGVVGYYLNLGYEDQQRYIAKIREENERLAPYAEIVADKNGKLGIVKKHVEDKFTAIAVFDMLNQLEVIKEKRARLTQFEFERGDEVVLRGHAKTLADINEFQDALESHRDFFTRVDNRDQSVRSLSGNRRVYSFDLVCSLKTIADQKKKSGSRSRRGGAPPGAPVPRG